MNLSFWSTEETLLLKEYELIFPIFSDYVDITENYSDESFIKIDLLEPTGLGFRVEKITVTKHENYLEGEIKWSIESEELIWFNKMIMGSDLERNLGLEGFELKESKWNEIIIELKEFIRDIK